MSPSGGYIVENRATVDGVESYQSAAAILLVEKSDVSYGSELRRDERNSQTAPLNFLRFPHLLWEIRDRLRGSLGRPSRR